MVDAFDSSEGTPSWSSIFSFLSDAINQLTRIADAMEVATAGSASTAAMTVNAKNSREMDAQAMVLLSVYGPSLRKIAEAMGVDRRRLKKCERFMEQYDKLTSPTRRGRLSDTTEDGHDDEE